MHGLDASHEDASENAPLGAATGRRVSRLPSRSGTDLRRSFRTADPRQERARRIERGQRLDHAPAAEGMCARPMDAREHQLSDRSRAQSQRTKPLDDFGLVEVKCPLTPVIANQARTSQRAQIATAINQDRPWLHATGTVYAAGRAASRWCFPCVSPMKLRDKARAIDVFGLPHRSMLDDQRGRCRYWWDRRFVQTPVRFQPRSALGSSTEVAKGAQGAH